MNDETIVAAYLARRDEAQKRLDALARSFLKGLTPIDTVTAFMGPALTILATAFGTAKACAYLRETADELEADEGAGGAGHA